MEYKLRGYAFERMPDGGTRITHHDGHGAVLGAPLVLSLEEWLNVLEHLIHSRQRIVKWKPPTKRGN